jgi:LAO/AO transport system kinase
MDDTRAQVERILKREPRAVARAISRIENESPAATELLKSLFAHTGRGLVVGLTGAPGAGKSSLVDKLALYYRAQNKSVGIVAVDPSSPFSGGALLGDRIRMQALSTDPHVFIRSMATRGNLGGLARATVDAVAVLDAAGYDRVLVETVGVGQDEVDVVKAADVSVVVLVPGMGDSIQAIKAGIMEIADVFVINKAERDGVAQTERELITLLEMSARADGWKPPIVRTVATENRGLAELAGAIESYGEFARTHRASAERRASIAEGRIVELLRDRLLRRALEAVGAGRLRQLAAEVAARRRDPYSSVEEIMKEMSENSSADARNERAAMPHQTERPGPQSDAPRKISHLGVAVASLDEALGFWRDALGLELAEVEVVEEQGVRVAMLPVGESRVELLEATGPDTPVGKFIAKRGAGVHHLCVEVADVAATLERLRSRGVRLIDEQPRTGAGGLLVAFIHPASAGGVLVELTERAARP